MAVDMLFQDTPVAHTDEFHNLVEKIYQRLIMEYHSGALQGYLDKAKDIEYRRKWGVAEIIEEYRTGTDIDTTMKRLCLAYRDYGSDRPRDSEFMRVIKDALEMPAVRDTWEGLRSDGRVKRTNHKGETVDG